MKYIVQSAIIENGEIVGYDVIDESGNTKKLKLDDIFKIASLGQTNCEVVLDNQNKKHLLFNSKSEPNTDDEKIHSIECRIMSDGSLLGYKVKSTDGKTRRLRPLKVWEMAANGKISNAKAIIVNNKPTLIGTEIKLAELPVLNM